MPILGEDLWNNNNKPGLLMDAAAFVFVSLDDVIIIPFGDLVQGPTVASSCCSFYSRKRVYG